MTRKIIIEQEEKIYKNFFGKGISISGLILLNLKESGEMFLRSLPDCYPGFSLMKKFFGVKSRYSYKMPEIEKKTFEANLWRLKKQGLIQKIPKQKVFTLTENGKRIMENVENRILMFEKPWDGKIRLVAFDIPENKRYLRDWIRGQLASFKFKLFQQSVYVGKYPLPESFYKILIKEGANQFVCILTVGEVDNREEILKMLGEK